MADKNANVGQHRTIFRLLVIAILACFHAISCSNVPTAPSLSQAQSAPYSAPSLLVRDGLGAYQLGAGDQLRLIVFDEPELSGTFAVDDSGKVSLPLIGLIAAHGLRVADLEQRIVAAYKDGYVRNPRVSLEVVRYRPFYISGEVEDDGEYPYVVNLTVPQAIATAGGYSRRAHRKKVFITRSGSMQRYEYPANQSTLVFPGDVIEVPERLF
ncbi:MAG: polysaccharide biosynthesis/export family protein [Pseudomonadota bacterium]